MTYNEAPDNLLRLIFALIALAISQRWIRRKHPLRKHIQQDIH